MRDTPASTSEPTKGSRDPDRGATQPGSTERERRRHSPREKRAAATLPVTVICCTKDRPHLLSLCLESVLAGHRLPREIVVVENSPAPRCEDIVALARDRTRQAGLPVDVRYAVERTPGISYARNTGVALGRERYVAFIDDDETADVGWLANLFRTSRAYTADIVCGPVIPLFPQATPDWLARSGAFRRYSGPTGPCPRKAGGTGNVLFSRAALQERDEPFSTRYALTGGSDSDLFAWLRLRGFRFAWSAEAVVFEQQERERLSVRWHVRRGYRTGWCYASQELEHGRKGSRSWKVLGRVVTSTGATILRAAGELPNVRSAGLVLGRGMASQAGKMAAFLDRPLYEYGPGPS
jgi:succinoglycan biosynthesis protein ExoM